MENTENAIEMYYMITSLKDMIRQGAVQWNVQRPRLESVAEHIFSAQVLAISLYTQNKVKVDLPKVLFMLAVHELEEIEIGDKTVFDNVCKDDKLAMGRAAVTKLLSNFNNTKCIEDIINEYNEGKTLEARFSKACDKLDNVLEFKKYVDNGQVSLNNATAEMLKHPKLQELLKQGRTSLEDIWFYYHQPSYEEFGICSDIWENTIKPINTKNNY